MVARIVAVLALAGAMWVGWTLSDRAWEARWAGRNASDKAAELQLERAERGKEEQWYSVIEEVRNNGNKRIQAAGDAIAVADSRADSLRKSIDDYAARLVDSQKRLGAALAAGGKAEPAGCGVLPELLKQSDRMAGIYAAQADTARARGMTCEQAYDAIKKAP